MRCTTPPFWFRLLALACLFWTLSAFGKAVVPALDLTASVPCGEFTCYPDLNAPNVYYIEPLTMELVEQDGEPRIFLIHAHPEQTAIPQAPTQGVLYAHLHYVLDEPLLQKAREDLAKRYPKAQIAGATPIGPGVLTLALQTDQGDVELIAKGRITHTSATKFMALFTLNTRQMTSLAALDGRPPKRWVLALEAGVLGWVPPLTNQVSVDVPALTAELFSADIKRWSGSELLAAVAEARHQGWVVVGSEDENENESETKATLAILNAHLMAEWFRPTVALSSFDSNTPQAESTSLIRWIKQSLDDAAVLKDVIQNNGAQPSAPLSQLRWFEKAATLLPWLGPVIVTAQATDIPKLSADKMALWRLAQKANDEGAQAYAQKKYAQAVESFSRAYELYNRVYVTPSSAIEYNLAQSYRRMGQCPQAIVFYEQVISTVTRQPEKLYPGYASYSLLFLAQCLVEQKRSNEAIDYLYQVARMPATPEKGQVLMEAAEMFYKLKRYCPALEMYREADRYIGFEEGAYSGQARDRFKVIAKKAIDEIRARETRLTRSASIESLQQVISEYRDYLLCAMPEETQQADINQRIARIDSQLTARSKLIKGPVKSATENNDSISLARRSALHTNTYRFASPNGISAEVPLVYPWRPSMLADKLHVLATEQVGAQRPSTTLVRISLTGQNESFFKEQVERVEVQVRPAVSSEGSETPPITTLQITPALFSSDANLFLLNLPESASTVLGVDVKATWHYKGGAKIELPLRHFPHPWVILDSPHRERAILLAADPKLIKENSIQSVRLVFFSQIDAQNIQHEVTLVGQAPFLNHQIKFPVSIRPTPIMVEAHWKLSWGRTVSHRFKLLGGRLDWSVLPSETKESTP